jgi:phage repressor protein C with HTH and peptisase S24 domain
MMFDDIFSRVLTKTPIANQSALASFLNIRKASVTGAKQRDAFPAEWALRIAGEYDLSTDWIMTGKGPMRREGGGSEVDRVEEAGVPYKLSNDYVEVPRYDIKAAAGAGADIQSEQIVDHLAFKRDFIRDKLRVRPDKLALINTIGDSMEPTILADDLLLINLDINHTTGDGIYILQGDMGLQVKRVQSMIGGGLVIKSDNPRYDALNVGLDQLDLVHIVGRVVWFGRQI